MGDSSTQPKQTVLVTGFGPFGSHCVNSSWVAAQELSRIGLDVPDTRLVVLEIPVEYDYVKKTIPELWKRYKPQLVVHVGLSGIAREITLEQQAHNDGYDRCDVSGRVPPMHCCVSGATSERITSGLDMSRICSWINSSQRDLDAVVSLDPGRYLCDYIYFTSLSQDPARTAFIHLPPLNKPYSARQLAEGLRLSIRAMLEQLQ